MKNTMKLAVIAALALGATTFTFCGGGSASGGGKVKQNEYLGKLPAIYADYLAEKEGLQNKTMEEARKMQANGGDAAKFAKLQKDQEAKLEELAVRFHAAALAETRAVAGREIPVSYSEALKNSGELFYTVETPVKLTDTSDPDDFRASPTFTLKIVATSDTKSDSKIYYRFLSSDGTTLETGFGHLNVVGVVGSKVFKAGETIEELESGVGAIVYYPAEWAEFAGIEFITGAEKSAAERERSERHKNN